MKFLLMLTVLLPALAQAQIITRESTSDYVIPVPYVLKDGKVTVCTEDGKCSNFSANQFALVPRRQHHHSKTVEMLPNPKAAPITNTNTSTVIVNMPKQSCETQIRTIRVPTFVEGKHRKNLIGLLIGYGPNSVEHSQPDQYTNDYDLKRGLVGGASYSHRLSSSWFLGVQGYSNGMVMVGPQVEF
jgi:hypothetical protein